ncbi:MAG: hypothetical protein FWH55_01885 [Oscillospiraceae bacterium]|nr:hypothetical protein [Oscillospiraceae bacterium]
MDKLVAFYSYTGHTRRIAQECASKEAADIVEIKDVKCPGKLKAYTAGCFSAMRGKAWPIQPLSSDLTGYNNLILFSPVWAGNPPPPVHAFLELLPKGISVSIKMVSASGRSNCLDKLEKTIKTKAGALDGFENIKA